jgi:hypothetical protein
MAPKQVTLKASRNDPQLSLTESSALLCDRLINTLI